ncbi:MAG TPA: ABC transporter permease [Bacteroidales bacterium]|nr:ABC transporter permease [Bacteroidales bacterium]HQB55835.1 ABC transporter permease [Bacteroidales bacterium]
MRKKSFLIATFLTPLLMAALITVPMLMTTVKDNREKIIEVIDPSGIGQSVLEDQEYTSFKFVKEGDLEQYKQTFDIRNIHAVCVIEEIQPNNVDVRMYSTGQIDQDVQKYVSRQISSEVEKRKLESYNIPELKEIMENIKTNIQVKSFTWTETGDEKETITEVYMAIAYLSSFLIYMFIFMYGSMVIRGVIEEKTNRIVEVIISSVKPVELMLGKIVGVALVALLQFLLWILLTIIIIFIVMIALGSGTVSELTQTAPQIQGGLAGAIASFDTGSGVLTGIASTLSQIHVGKFLLSFCLYFIGGYLMYASMFAAIGSVSDAETDTQQFQLPITIPLILGLFIMMHTFQHPDSSLSVWASMIPFTSPMVMLARLPFGGVPLWQLIVSIVLLFLSFLAAVYFSAKIYKVGILMYGKKVTWKELWKWMRYKNG